MNFTTFKNQVSLSSFLHDLFNEYNAKYFGGIIKHRLELKDRIIHRKMGHCTRWVIAVYVNHNQHKSEINLKHTLLHEMCHAWQVAVEGKLSHTGKFVTKLREVRYLEFKGFRDEEYSSHPFRLENYMHNMENVNVIPLPLPVRPSLPFVAPVPALPLAATKDAVKRFKVVSTGKIGDFVREGKSYGRDTITLKIEGCLFPFTTDKTNVQAI